MAKGRHAGKPAADPATRKKTARQVSKTNAALTAEFRAAHAAGMAAIRQHDYAVLDRVISEEAQISAKQSKLITLSRETATKAKRKR